MDSTVSIFGAACGEEAILSALKPDMPARRLSHALEALPGNVLSKN